MKRIVVALAALLLPALALADADPRFARLRDQAEPLGSLSVFLDKYVGECGGLFAGLGCRDAADAFRKVYEGKLLYMIVGEDVATMAQPGSYQPGSGKYFIDVTPVFPGGAYVLTHGTPPQMGSDDRPILAPLHVSGTTPEGWSATDFLRLFSSHQVRLQVVFSPQTIWGLERKQGSGKQYGVAARLEAILLTHARTGEQLGLWFADAGAPAPASDAAPASPPKAAAKKKRKK